MKLFYAALPRGNFGDDLNQWLWDALMPGWRDWPDRRTLFGVGTLLQPANLERHRPALVMGSGYGYGAMPSAELIAATDFRAVRGPLTCRSFGLDAGLGITDPAAVIPTLGLDAFADLRPSGDAIFIPHYTSASVAIGWARVCEGAGLRYVSPGDESHAVIRAIAEARLVVTESMHGAILADAFRVPWVAVRFSDKFNEYKWNDWAAGLGMSVAPYDLLGPMRRPFDLAASRLRRPARPAPGSTTGAPDPSAPSAPKPAAGAVGGRLGQFGELAKRSAGRLDRLIVPWLSRRLRAAAAIAPSLSDDAVLAERQARFMAVVGETAAEAAARSR